MSVHNCLNSSKPNFPDKSESIIATILLQISLLKPWCFVSGTRKSKIEIIKTVSNNIILCNYDSCDPILNNALNTKINNLCHFSSSSALNYKWNDQCLKILKDTKSELIYCNMIWIWNYYQMSKNLVTACTVVI